MGFRLFDLVLAMIGSDELEDDKDESSAENDESSEIMVLFDSNRKYSSTANGYLIRLYSDTREVDPPNNATICIGCGCITATSFQLHRQFKEFSIVVSELYLILEHSYGYFRNGTIKTMF